MRVSITKIVQLITSREILRDINKKNFIGRNPGEIFRRKEKAENQKCPQWILRFSHRKLRVYIDTIYITRVPSSENK